MTSKETAAAADRMIDAAQQLEQAARQLKDQARILRRGSSLPASIDVKLWNMHKRGDIEQAAARALAVIGEEY